MSESNSKVQKLLWVWASAAGTTEEPFNTFAVVHLWDAVYRNLLDSLIQLCWCWRSTGHTKV